MVTVPPFRTMLPDPAVRPVRAVALPTAPPKVILPPVLSVKRNAPLTVLPNVMTPTEVLVSTVSAFRVTGSL